MASHREQPPLLIQPRFSRRLAAFVALTHLLAAAAILALPGAAWLLLLIPVGLSLTYQFYVRVLGRAPWSIRAATWQADGTWTIVLLSGTETEARLAPSTFVSVPLVVLNLRRGYVRRWALPLFADALDREQLRRLRQRLRIEGTGQHRDIDQVEHAA
ncbi:protein YgfX [uncultured Thiodictyon sp.]|jgi:toxin CptA|uniref:protein YgfX n=1 Tax=uncultured Thiodictyon sp. TaxID=1846217 RepID=UPI0025F6F923|nr:protein YgfX [uncultured Thiodictyon sp.]